MCLGIINFRNSALRTMKLLIGLLLLCFVATIRCNARGRHFWVFSWWSSHCQPNMKILLLDRFVNNPHNKNVAESEVSAQIFALLEHYKQKDPVGLPNAPVPDPLPVPYSKQSMGMATLTMKNASAYGLSKFRIKSVAVDVNQLIVRTSRKMQIARFV